MSSDPMNVDNVRARRAVDQAEKDMIREIDREVFGKPRSIMDALREALEDKK